MITSYVAEIATSRDMYEKNAYLSDTWTTVFVILQVERSR